MILVTGASGLVGRELIRRLCAADHPARGIDLSEAPAPRGAIVAVANLLDPAACRKACQGVHTIIHTAARQHHSGLPRWGRERFFKANEDMTRNLIGAAVAEAVGHVVFLSSDMVYGLPGDRPFTEVDAPRPIGPYGRSKLASEQVCVNAMKQCGMSVTIFRPRFIVGPGRLGVLKKLFDRIRMGRVVPILGDGLHRYQMVSVSDVAEACLLALKSRPRGIFNLGSADPPTVAGLLTAVCRRAGSPSKIISLPKPWARAALWSLHALRLAPLTPEQFCIADVDYVLDTARAEAELGWRPQFADVDMLWSAYDTYIAGLGRPRRVESSGTLRPRPAA